MLAPAALMKGLVSRLLPSRTSDGPESEGYARLGGYRDQMVEPGWATDHRQADEGSLFVASMYPGQTAIQLGISASFSATAAAFVLFNGNDPSSGKRCFPKALKLAQSVAPTSGVDLRYAIVIDSADRRPSTISNAPSSDRGPGTAATVTAYRAPAFNCNTDPGAPEAKGMVFFPFSTAGGAAPTVPAASQGARIITGNGYIKNSIPVLKDQYVLQFGSADRGGTFQAAAALAKLTEHAPAVCVYPGHTMLIYLWSASNITAGNAWDDASFEWVEK